MRYSMSLRPEQVIYLADVLQNLSARSVSGGQRLSELAQDARCQQLSSLLSRAGKRAAAGPPAKEPKRVPRETIDAIIGDCLDRKLSRKAIAMKHGVSLHYVYKIVRVEILGRAK